VLLKIIEEITILDPSVGAGFFLQKALQVLLEIHIDLIKQGVQKKSVSQIKVEIISNNLYGVDISSSAVETCKKGLIKEINAELSKDEETKLLAILTAKIKCGNAIIGEPFNSQKSHNLIDFEVKFNWRKEFPEILEGGGFAICLGNPPWNILKPLEKEFFSNFDSRISKYGITKQESNKIIAEIVKNKTIRTKWEEYCNSIKIQSKYFRTYYEHQTGDIPFGNKSRTVSGDINLYKIFLERAYHLLMKEGVLGFVVPSGLHSDAGSKGLRTLFLEQNTTIEVISFENKQGIFPSIHKSFKFDLITVIKNSQKSTTFMASFMQTEASFLNDERSKLLKLSWNRIKRYSPSSWAIIEFKDKKDLTIVEKLYNFPVLSDPSQEKWRLKLRRELDITNDSHLFNSEGKGVPIYEGKMIEQFTHRFKKPRFWITSKKIKKKFKQSDNSLKEFKLVFRAVAASTNRRTMISTLLPPGSWCGNSLIVVDSLNGDNYPKLTIFDKIFLSGILNSFVFDYLLRLKVSQNLNMFIIQDLPLPRISSKENIYLKLVSLTAALYMKFPEFQKLKNHIPNSDNSLLDASYEEVRARLDAFVAKLYKLNYDEFEYILTQFHIHESRNNEALNHHKNKSLKYFQELQST